MGTVKNSKVNKIELENNPNLINDIQDAFTEQYEYFD